MSSALAATACGPNGGSLNGPIRMFLCCCCPRHINNAAFATLFATLIYPIVVHSSALLIRGRPTYLASFSQVLAHGTHKHVLSCFPQSLVARAVPFNANATCCELRTKCSAYTAVCFAASAARCAFLVPTPLPLSAAAAHSRAASAAIFVFSIVTLAIQRGHGCPRSRWVSCFFPPPATDEDADCVSLADRFVALAAFAASFLVCLARSFFAFFDIFFSPTSFSSRCCITRSAYVSGGVTFFSSISFSSTSEGPMHQTPRGQKTWMETKNQWIKKSSKKNLSL